MYDFASFENDLQICVDTGAQRHISFCLTLANSFDQGMWIKEDDTLQTLGQQWVQTSHWDSQSKKTMQGLPIAQEVEKI